MIFDSNYTTMDNDFIKRWLIVFGLTAEYRKIKELVTTYIVDGTYKVDDFLSTVLSGNGSKTEAEAILKSLQRIVSMINTLQNTTNILNHSMARIVWWNDKNIGINNNVISSKNQDLRFLLNTVFNAELMVNQTTRGYITKYDANVVEKDYDVNKPDDQQSNEFKNIYEQIETVNNHALSLFQLHKTVLYTQQDHVDLNNGIYKFNYFPSHLSFDLAHGAAEVVNADVVAKNNGGTCASLSSGINRQYHDYYNRHKWFDDCSFKGYNKGFYFYNRVISNSNKNAFFLNNQYEPCPVNIMPTITKEDLDIESVRNQFYKHCTLPICYEKYNNKGTYFPIFDTMLNSLSVSFINPDKEVYMPNRDDTIHHKPKNSDQNNVYQEDLGVSHIYSGGAITDPFPWLKNVHSMSVFLRNKHRAYSRQSGWENHGEIYNRLRSTAQGIHVWSWFSYADYMEGIVYPNLINKLKQLLKTVDNDRFNRAYMLLELSILGYGFFQMKYLLKNTPLSSNNKVTLNDNSGDIILKVLPNDYLNKPIDYINNVIKKDSILSAKINNIVLLYINKMNVDGSTYDDPLSIGRRIIWVDAVNDYPCYAINFPHDVHAWSLNKAIGPKDYRVGGAGKQRTLTSTNINGAVNVKKYTIASKSGVVSRKNMLAGLEDYFDKLRLKRYVRINLDHKDDYYFVRGESGNDAGQRVKRIINDRYSVTTSGFVIFKSPYIKRLVVDNNNSKKADAYISYVLQNGDNYIYNYKPFTFHDKKYRSYSGIVKRTYNGDNYTDTEQTYNATTISNFDLTNAIPRFKLFEDHFWMGNDSTKNSYFEKTESYPLYSKFGRGHDSCFFLESAPDSPSLSGFIIKLLMKDTKIGDINFFYNNSNLRLFAILKDPETNKVILPDGRIVEYIFKSNNYSIKLTGDYKDICPLENKSSISMLDNVLIFEYDYNDTNTQANVKTNTINYKQSKVLRKYNGYNSTTEWSGTKNIYSLIDHFWNEWCTENPVVFRLQYFSRASHNNDWYPQADRAGILCSRSNGAEFNTYVRDNQASENGVVGNYYSMDWDGKLLYSIGKQRTYQWVSNYYSDNGGNFVISYYPGRAYCATIELRYKRYGYTEDIRLKNNYCGNLRDRQDAYIMHNNNANSVNNYGVKNVFNQDILEY